MDENNTAFSGNISYVAEHFGHKKFNLIWKMPSVLLSQTLAVELEGQEQWPDDVKIYQPCEMDQILLPDNANCLAVQTYLRMSGLKFTVEHRSNAEFMSPSGNVPFIRCGAFLVSEFEGIVGLVNNKNINISERLEQNDRSDMRAYMSLVNTVMQNVEHFICWCDNETYKTVTWKRYGSIFPFPLNYIITWQKKKIIQGKLAVLEWKEKGLQKVLEDFNICCQSLSQRLDDKPYYFGNKPTELDALVFGHIFSIIATRLPGNHLSPIVHKYPNLIELCKRIEKEYFEKRSE